MFFKNYFRKTWERAILSQMESLCKDLGSKLKCFSNYASLEI